MEIDTSLMKNILTAQKNEITEYLIYKKLSLMAQGQNKAILEKVSAEELAHHNFWKKFTKQEVKPSMLKLNLYYSMSRFLGLNFGLKLMEKGEDFSQSNYRKLLKVSPEVRKIIKDEERHEDRLLALLDKKELMYTGSIILGLNDALVELTGALAGLTLALRNPKIIAVAGLITGIAASLSMAGSEYLSTKEEGAKNPLKASIYTGISYLLVVALLIFPFFILSKPLLSLAITISSALLIILVFNFYISVAKNLSFKRRFLEMAIISLGVAVFNFFVGLLINIYLKVGI